MINRIKYYGPHFSMRKLELQRENHLPQVTLGRQNPFSVRSPAVFPQSWGNSDRAKGVPLNFALQWKWGRVGIWQHAKPHDDIFISAKKNALSNPHQPKTRSYQDFAI